MTGLSRRAVLRGSGAAVAVATVAVPAVQAEDAELITLGRQWIVAYGEWIGTFNEDKDSTLLNRCCSIEDEIADIPARSHHGVLVKLRVVAEHYRLMGDIDDSRESRLTYQAWQALETESFDFGRLQREKLS